MEFPKPKLKRKKGATRLGNQPVGKQDQETSAKCTGVLVGDSVCVYEAPDITKLLRYGVYGQTAFSGSLLTRNTTRVRSLTAPSSDERSRRKESRKRTRLLQEDDTTFQKEVLESGQEKAEQLLHAEEKKDECLMSQKQTIISSGVEAMVSEVTHRDINPLSTSDEDRECDGSLETSRTIQKINIPTSDESRVSAMIEDPTECSPVTVPLCLGPEEAFYLMAELECLEIYIPTDTVQCLTLEEFWKELCLYCHRFPFIYTAYQHYRRKGWVPKPGAKFGVDLILYKDGPDYYHSSYAILICEQFNETVETVKEERMVGHESGEKAFGDREKIDDLECTRGLLKWIDVIAHCRVSESTAKELVLCYITVPSDYDMAKISSSHECVKLMKVSEVLVTRWLPEKDR